MKRFDSWDLVISQNFIWSISWFYYSYSWFYQSLIFSYLKFWLKVKQIWYWYFFKWKFFHLVKIIFVTLMYNLKKNSVNDNKYWIIHNVSSEKVPNVDAQNKSEKYFSLLLEKFNLTRWTLMLGGPFVVIMKLHYPVDRRRFQHWVENKSFNHSIVPHCLFWSCHYWLFGLSTAENSKISGLGTTLYFKTLLKFSKMWRNFFWSDHLLYLTRLVSNRGFIPGIIGGGFCSYYENC